METITAASNVQITSDTVTPYNKIHDDDVEQQQPIVVDENQENSVDNHQCQSQCIQMSKQFSNKAAQMEQACGCEQQRTDCVTTNGQIVNGSSDTVMANTTNATKNHIQLNGQSTKLDFIKANGLHVHRRDKENSIGTNGVGGGGGGVDDMDVCDYQMNYESNTHILANLCDDGRDNSLDAMVSSDLDDTEITLAIKKCTNAIISNGSEQNGRSNNQAHCDEEGKEEEEEEGHHRRTRARSESDQCDFFEARKQQMRRQATAQEDESNQLENGSDDNLLQCETAADRTIYGKTLRGKSLSPPKIASNRRQFINSHALISRALAQRHLPRPLHIIRKQKLLSKARQQANKLSPRHSPTTMGKSIAPKEIDLASKEINSKSTDKTTDNKIHSGSGSDSEYSSLEDDDDVQEATDSDKNDLSDVDDSDRCDNKAIYNSYKGSLNVSTSLDYSILGDSVQGQVAKAGPLTPSLFANVPPFITFVTHDEKGPVMPAEIKKILKWKLTTITPIVIRKVLLNSGFRLLKQTNDWMGTWGKHMKSPCFRGLRSHQKINHIPGSFQIGRKDRIWRNLQSQMARNGRKEFYFMPLTYILPQDVKRLKRLWPQFAQRNTKWIIKPPASARGTGIKVVNKWTQIPKRKPMIVQKYIDRPLLINGSKFDLRLYVLVTSLNPLRAYMHTDGLARFASVKYSNDIDTLNDRYMHLTNYSINKLSSNYAKNEDAESCNGHKWTLKTLWKYFQAQGINTDGLWAALRNLVLRTILTGEHVINQMTKVNVNSKYNTFELFGIDVILDSELKPWLLEVNISPSLHSSSPLDLHVKGPLVTALLNTVLFNVPPRFNVSQQAELMATLGLTGHNLCYDRRLHINTLSKGERLKQNKFSNKSMSNRDEYLDAILEHLTPDDIRCLIKTEDELDRCAPLERICPTPNSHRYIKFTESPRYYNRLLDAWENRYSNRRQDGVDLLRKYCESRIHLIIPQPVPKLNGIQNGSQTTEQDERAEQNSDDECDEVFEVTSCALSQRRTELLDTIETNPLTNIKNSADLKGPIPVSDEQLNDSHDNLVSSIA